MSAPDVTTSFARALVDEWVRGGITHAVVAPGSRNTPLTLALVRDGRVEVDVVVDERSAGFRALGLGLATGRPAIVCCTSGTAAANLYPAVIEAHHARVPLLVCTADRPPELRDWGAGQTIDQTHLFGNAVRWFHDPGPPEAAADADARWRGLAARACALALGPAAGPVHLNLPFREPLVPTGAPLVDTPGREHNAPWVHTMPVRHDAAPDEVARVAARVAAAPRGVLVAGWGANVSPATSERFAVAAAWPVLADPLSGLRTGAAISTYEALLRSEPFARTHAPELVLRVGAPLTSKVANAWLDAAPTTLIVDPDGAWLDPTRAATERVPADADAFLEMVAAELAARDDQQWIDGWHAAEGAARVALDDVLDDDLSCDARVARDVAAAVPDGAALVVASSTPVRTLEWAMAPRPGVDVYANRGANGIDGFVATALGIAAGRSGPTVALTGDLGFLHDTNGLLTARDGAPVTFVVIDNDGGGIFGYLPQHDLPEFERLFATPQGVDLVAVARAHGVDAERVERVADVAKLVREGAGATRVLVVPVDRAAALRQHRRIWSAVATKIS